MNYEISSNKNMQGYRDAGWPKAKLYSASTVGVSFPAYANFASQWSQFNFIWSSTLILDNVVLVRKTVSVVTGLTETGSENDVIKAILTYENISFVFRKEFRIVKAFLFDLT
jgi:hypothetical protein